MSSEINLMVFDGYPSTGVPLLEHVSVTLTSAPTNLKIEISSASCRTGCE